MRRILGGLLSFLLIGGLVPGAAAQTHAGAEVARGASALWWRHNGDTGTLYFLDVYEFTGTDTRPHMLRGFVGTIPCEVGRRNRPSDCHHRKAEYDRVKVNSFEIDPLLGSAHAVVQKGDRVGEVAWTGRGDFNQPFLWQSVNEFADPPYFAHLSAGVAAFVGRDASARGDLFGLDLKRREFLDAGLVNFLYGGASVCAGGPWCFFGGTPS